MKEKLKIQLEYFASISLVYNQMHLVSENWVRYYFWGLTHIFIANPLRNFYNKKIYGLLS